MLFILGTFCLIPIVWSQNNVLELLPGSQLLGFDEQKGVHRLVGTVNFTYQGNTMYCDSAHYSDKTAQVWAYGNVHITKNDVNLFCDSLYYNGKERKAKLWGHVRARDQQYKLLTDSLEYDAKRTQATYRNGGRIENITDNSLLTSKIGYFHPNTKDFFVREKVAFRNKEIFLQTDTIRFNYKSQTSYFYGPTRIKRKNERIFCESGWYNHLNEEGSLQKNASISSNNIIIHADTLHYQPKEGLTTGMGRVRYVDTTEQVAFWANYAVNSEKTHSTLLTGNALAKKIQGNDTIFIHADTLLNQLDSTDKHLYSKAYNHVKLFNVTLQAVCDSLIFIQDSIKMFNQPIAWSKNSELKGEKMYILLKDSLIDQIQISENATVIMELDSGIYYNQIAGRKIDVFFIENELVRANVNGNAKTIFYPQEEEKTDSTIVLKRLGLNRLYAGSIRVTVNQGEISGISYMEKPEGVFYPMEKLKKEDQFISNFEWKVSIRPKSWQDLLRLN